MSDIIKKAEFVLSSPNERKCPPPDRPEYAFIGRSNVGKSSLINMLTGRTHLAKVSGRPGKTQLINHFMVDDTWYLVDLPGYGWARVSKTEKEKWQGMIADYLVNRSNLINTFVLVDSRLEPQKIDLEFMEWMGEKGLPFSIVFTKADKLGKTKVASGIAHYKKVLKNTWEALPPIFITSSADKTGRTEILDYIHELNASIDI